MSLKRLLEQTGTTFLLSYTPRGEVEVKTTAKHNEVIVRALMKYGTLHTNEGKWTTSEGEVLTHRLVLKDFGPW